jgi:hypothetical protein
MLNVAKCNPINAMIRVEEVCSCNKLRSNKFIRRCGKKIRYLREVKGHKRTHSGGSRLKNISMAAENAAKARPPPKTALGPECRARIPPATNPAATEFVISFLARYCKGYKITVNVYAD